MDFITIVSIVLVASGIVSLFDVVFSAKKRQQTLAQTLQKKRQLDYPSQQQILAKPWFVETTDNLFGTSIALAIIWSLLPNFELILVIALVLSLLITIIEKSVIKKQKKKALTALYQRNANPHEQEVEDVQRMPWWTDYGWSFFPLLLIIVSLRSFYYEPFKIPSGSMKPTLLVHDFILVNKYAYGVRLPVTKTKITQGDQPKRGDVVVFRAPHQPDKDFIKRLIALPGDIVFYRPDGSILIQPNCETADREQQAIDLQLKCGEPNLMSRQLISPRGFEGKYDVYDETLAGVEHKMIQRTGITRRNKFDRSFGPYIQRLGITSELDKRRVFAAENKYWKDWAKGVEVPEGSFFVMGDNRDGSSDARFWGFVPEQRLVGKADFIWLNLEFGLAETGFLSYIPTGANFDRVGAID